MSRRAEIVLNGLMLAPGDHRDRFRFDNNEKRLDIPAIALIRRSREKNWNGEFMNDGYFADFYIDGNGDGWIWPRVAEFISNRNWQKTSREFAKLLLLAAFPEVP